ncbi:hypothetical protein [Bradyrhizobium sp. Cp5.3]|uniref:hypothetical protein n=1 Tax=Bradyrhizobium sp. Cp5.3 TaxID=443598 RepID=UPI0012EC8A17|nr:hypothetical protein [Bradyrhizobium sp. Cp5.3]
MKNGRFDPKRDPHLRHPSHRERLDQAASALQQQLEQRSRHLAERAAKSEAERVASAARAVRSPAAYQAALTAIPFSRPGEPARLSVSPSYQRLLDTALRCLEGRAREAVLCWPEFDVSPAAVAAFLTLADNAAAKEIKHDALAARAPPLGLRALIFPYASSAHRPLRRIYIDKESLGRLHTQHQVRAMRRDEDPALEDYHKALARAKTLTGQTLDGNTYDEFRHPCLDEILPSGPCTGNDGRKQLLWRVKSKTDLLSIKRSNQADDPANAKFYLFGLRGSDNAAASLKSLRKQLDIVLLDLGQTGRNRLGRDWEKRVQTFLAELDRHVGPVAVLALTDDPWTFDKLRFETLRGPAQGKTRAKPVPSDIVFGQASDLVVAEASAKPTYSQITKQDAIGFSGEVETLLKRVRANARVAYDLGDASATELLYRLGGILRRCASLPGPRSDFSAYVEQEAGNLAAADLLASYRTGAVIAEIKGSVGPWAQNHRAELLDLCASVDRVWNNTAQLTPMAPLLRDVVKKFERTSSRTAILFRNDMLSDFASFVLCKDEEIGVHIEARIDKNMLLFLDKESLGDLAKLKATERNQIKTLICVAPTRSQILSLLARPWLPENLIVLADSDTLASAARDGARLLAYPELADIHKRVSVFVEKAGRAVHRDSGVAEANVASEDEDVEFPASSVVNLAGNVRPNQPTIRFRLSGDQIVVARPGTKLILLDHTRTVPLFIETEAKDVDIGDRICVIGDAFLEMARPLLNITARAAEEIRDYHHLVLDRFARLPGTSVHDKLVNLVATMNFPAVTVQRAGYWISLRDQLDVPLHEVVPHAPRDRSTFMAFMGALGVSESIAARFWTWAVIAQRTSRLRAAFSFHDAYRTILIDTYAAQSSNPERARDIRRLKAAAQDFVAVVQEKTEQRGECDRA